MRTGLLHLHSYLPYLFLILLVIGVFKSIIGWSGKKEFTGGDARLSLINLVLAHIQLLVGLILLFTAGYFSAGMGEIMKNEDLRFKAIEHPFTMILAVVLITIGRSRSKKFNTGVGKHKQIALFYGLGLALILSRIPWSNWLG
ncbi:MAG: hypothetical protein LPK28_06315 [Bacteroidota bacterium]|nr:hypothetical protein [Bacteroidota bacterium]